MLPDALDLSSRLPLRQWPNRFVASSLMAASSPRWLMLAGLLCPSPVRRFKIPPLPMVLEWNYHCKSLKLAASLGPRFYLNIYKCKHISETGAQQMLLDTQAVKTILLDIPALGKKTTVAASYSKFVSREMSKAKALLKVILSPVDSIGNTYYALLPEGTPLEFQQILELKGLKKADQQAIVDDFSIHDS